MNALADFITEQNWAGYTPAEHATWDRLYARQSAMLSDRAAPAFLAGLQKLGLSQPGVPDLAQLSERLHALTGWKVVAVPGLIPDALFFRALADRTFVAGRFIRSPHQTDYLQEPDIFHDIFGHVPLLADPVFADYMQAYGEGGLRSLRFDALHHLARLYWYTVEFGLIRDGEALKICGAGILSSYGESQFALDDPSPHRLGLDLKRVMRTPYKIDDYQRTYFVIDSFEDLLRQTLTADFAPLYRDLAGAPDLTPDSLLATDIIFTRGTQTRPVARKAA